MFSRGVRQLASIGTYIYKILIQISLILLVVCRGLLVVLTFALIAIYLLLFI